MMNDLTISFHLKWRNGTEELIRQFKGCQNEEELLELIKDNMIISIPINNERLIKDEWLATQVCHWLNEQQNIINKQNGLIKLIADACTYSKEHSVKEILRNEIKGIDTVTYESAGAWHDYVLLSEFFEKHYKEHWDNE